MKKIPVYNDGIFHLYRINEPKDGLPKEGLEDLDIDIWFNEISIGDRIKNELNQNKVQVTTKIRIPQYKKIDSKCVLKIGEVYHKVYNTYHFMNTDGFLESDITLEWYVKRW